MQNKALPLTAVGLENNPSRVALITPDGIAERDVIDLRAYDASIDLPGGLMRSALIWSAPAEPSGDGALDRS
jgi:hypothetical protein